jgi:hypothetical protein
MAVALDASTPSPVYGDTAANTSLVTAAFTPPSGSIVVAKIVSGDAGQTHTTPTGLTFTSRVNVGTFNASTRCSLFTATGGGASVSITAAFAGTANLRGLMVEVWTGAQLAATPATHSVVAGAGAPTDSITTAAAGSIVSWLDGDWSAIAPGTPAYRSSATQLVTPHTVTGQYTTYSAYQAGAGAGVANTYGLTSPAGQTYTLASIEIQSSGGAAPAIPPIIVLAPRR